MMDFVLKMMDFAKVLSNLKAYALSKGYGKVYFGPQAVSRGPARFHTT